MILNALTIDVEDYFQVSAFSNEIDFSEWDNYESHVEVNTCRILDILDENSISATFFILGWIAKKYPGLVQKIHQRGHEISSHGLNHQLIYTQSSELFRRETEESKKILEDIIQTPVIGYRAASFSITPKNKWALDIIAETGFKYDSSLFPISHDVYGMPDIPDIPYMFKTDGDRELIEFPITTCKIGKINVPVAGGGYFRLYPYFISKKLLKKINDNGKPFLFYLHPWEMDTTQPKINSSILSKFRHYNNIEKCEKRFRQLVTDFKFTTMRKILKDIDLLNY